MVRTLYPGSEVTFKLPNQGVVAGVRGTVFDINLERGYIHSVDHVVTLKNRLLQSVELMPGEIVSAADILKKLASSALDATWEGANQLRDQAYELARSVELEAAWNRLAGVGDSDGWWGSITEWFDRVVRWILEKFGMFSEIDFAKKLQSLDGAAIMNMPQEQLLKWYQTLKSKDFVEERDLLRGAIMNMSGQLENAGAYMDVLFRESLWDKVEFPQIDLAYTNEILSSYAARMQLDVNALINSLQSQDYTQLLQEKFQSLFR